MPIARPSNLTVPFANVGARNVIPVADAAPLASFTLGFPPVTMLPIIAGGEPPDGKDFNGILYDITTHTMWVNAGGQYLFDATLSAAIGGYPIGMVLQSDDGLSAYVSAVAANTTNFNSSPGSIGSAWMPWAGAALRNAAIIWCGTSGGSANVQTFTPTPPVAALVAGQTFSGIAGFTNTASLTVNISGLGPIVVKRDSPAGPIPLTGGEWVAGNIVSLKFDGTFLQLTDTDLGQLALLNIGQGLENDGAGNARVKRADLSIYRSALGITSAKPIASVSTPQTLVITDNQKIYIATTGVVLTAPLSSTLFNGFGITVLALSGASTFTPNAADAINGGTPGSSSSIIQGQTVDFDTDAAGNWWATGRTTPAGAYYPLYENASTTVGPGSYLVNTSGGAISLTLPGAPATGDSLKFEDAAGTWTTNTLTLLRNGQTIEGFAENLIANVSGLDFEIWFNGTTWKVR